MSAIPNLATMPVPIISRWDLVRPEQEFVRGGQQAISANARAGIDDYTRIGQLGMELFQRDLLAPESTKNTTGDDVKVRYKPDKRAALAPGIQTPAHRLTYPVG